MGIRDTQYIIARHHDTKHPHCHLVFNRIDNEGNLISDSNERIRNTKICRALTKEYGLYFAPKIVKPETRVVCALTNCGSIIYVLQLLMHWLYLVHGMIFLAFSKVRV